MKWALVIVYMSGFWDSGLRYETHDICMLKGVRESYVLRCRGRVPDKYTTCRGYDIHPPIREQYHNVFKCLPIK